MYVCQDGFSEYTEPGNVKESHVAKGLLIEADRALALRGAEFVGNREDRIEPHLTGDPDILFDLGLRRRCVSRLDLN